MSLESRHLPLPWRDKNTRRDVRVQLWEWLAALARLSSSTSRDERRFLL